MKSPKGEMFWNTGVYKDVVPNRRIVSTMSFADETGKAVPGSKAPVPGRWPNAVTVIVEFSGSSGKTKVTVTEVGLPLIVMILSRVAWGQQFDRLRVYFEGRRAPGASPDIRTEDQLNMSNSTSTFLTRNLQEVFGENDPARRRGYR
jgi:Activator of Hsp90 ATPase homolog 1-like protein